MIQNQFTLGAALAVPLLCGTALADTVRGHFVGRDSGRVIVIAESPGSPTLAGGLPVWAGAATYSFGEASSPHGQAAGFANRTMRTFGVDLLSTHGEMRDFEVQRLGELTSQATAAPWDGASPGEIGEMRANAIMLGAQSLGWLDNLGGFVHAGVQGSDDARAAAIQILLWDSLWDVGPVDPKSLPSQIWNLDERGGTQFAVRKLDPQIADFVNKLRNTAGAFLGSPTKVRALTGSGGDDGTGGVQMVVVVPLPAAALAGACGFAGLIGANCVRRRRFRQRA